MTKQNSEVKSLERWHQIMGHCNLKDILALENVVNGMRITDKKDFDCDTCVMGKMTQIRSRVPGKGASKILDLVHCDLAGPIQPEAKGGYRYAISFTVVISSVIMIYFLKEKSDTPEVTEIFLADIAPYGNVKALRTDNGTAFTMSLNHISEPKTPY